MVALLGLLIFIFVRHPYTSGEPIRSDGMGYHIWTYELLGGDLSFCEYQDAHPEYIRDLPTTTSRPHPTTNRCSIKYPMGVALLRLPLTAAFVDWSQAQVPHPSEGEHRMVLVAGSLAVLAIFLFSFLAAFNWTGCESSSTFASLFVILGCGLLHYGTFDAGFSHIYSAFLFSILLWLISRRPRQATEACCAFFLALFLVQVRNTNIFPLIFIFLWKFSRQNFKFLRNPFYLALGVGALAGGLLQLGLNHYWAQSFHLSNYEARESFSWGEPKFLKILFSYAKGFFLYSPLALVILLKVFWRKPLAPEKLFLAGLFLFYAYLNSVWFDWAFGGGFGHRAFVDISVFLIPFLANNLRMEAPKKWPFFALACSLSVWLSLILMRSYWTGNYPYGQASQGDYYQAIRQNISSTTGLVWLLAAFLIVLLWVRVPKRHSWSRFS